MLITRGRLTVVFSPWFSFVLKITHRPLRFAAAMPTICYALDEIKFGDLPDCEGTLYIEKREVSRG
jgi:hypothetical protein